MTDVNGLFYQKDMESIHAVEKCIQNYTKEDVVLVIENLKKLSDRQDLEEVRALFGTGNFVLSAPYQRFKLDSGTWHSWGQNRRNDHVRKFREYVPNPTDMFSKPINSGRKPCFRSRQKVKTPDVVEDRHEQLKKASGAPIVPASSSKESDAPGFQTTNVNEHIR